MPHVSVIIPLYNKSRYIARALDSALDQTFRDIEVIVVDDGSTDDGPEIVGRCEDARVRLIRQTNAGPGSARNRGIAQATGSCVAFLDADDEWLPTFLERTLRILEEDPDCGAVATAYYLGEAKMDVVPVFRQQGLTDGLWSMDSCRNLRDLRSAIRIFSSSTTVVRRRVVEQYGGFYEKDRCRYGEDYYLWVQVLFGHSVFRLLEPLVWYHIEASELGVRPKSVHVLEPMFTDPEPIRRGCPPSRRALLERWLALFALATAHDLTVHGDFARAAWLAEAFPLMRTLHWEYAKLRVKLNMPGMISHIRRLKRWLRGCRSA